MVKYQKSQKTPSPPHQVRPGGEIPLLAHNKGAEIVFAIDEMKLRTADDVTVLPLPRLVRVEGGGVDVYSIENLSFPVLILCHIFETTQASLIASKQQIFFARNRPPPLPTPSTCRGGVWYPGRCLIAYCRHDPWHMRESDDWRQRRSDFIALRHFLTPLSFVSDCLLLTEGDKVIWSNFSHSLFQKVVFPLQTYIMYQQNTQTKQKQTKTKTSST